MNQNVFLTRYVEKEMEMNRKSFNRVHVMTAILSAALLALGVSPARAAEQNGSTVDKTYLLVLQR